MSKRKAIAQVLAAGIIASLSVGMAPSAEAQSTRCKPYIPYKYNSSARVNIPNYCSSSGNSRGQLQRYRGWAVGWRVVASVNVPAGTTRRASWDCGGVGTYSYRALNTVGNTYLFTGDEARFSC